mmetsp:Transcript_29404/g.47383  ORF Transcript_29404/g.47383 Transcript_29404/m.47383 type:complete len:105 (-) Transcript_29404:295-609(-)
MCIAHTASKPAVSRRPLRAHCLRAWAAELLSSAAPASGAVHAMRPQDFARPAALPSVTSAHGVGNNARHAAAPPAQSSFFAMTASVRRKTTEDKACVLIAMKTG